MRIWTTALFALAFASEAAAAGAYASHPARDAQACARLCADDGLCIAWSLTPEGACQLRATTPEGPSGIASGFSQRAPAAMRQATINLSAPAAITAPPPAAQPDHTTAPSEEAPDNTELLGGLASRDQAPELRLDLRD